jgi:hypothetical protein
MMFGREAERTTIARERDAVRRRAIFLPLLRFRQVCGLLDLVHFTPTA